MRFSFILYQGEGYRNVLMLSCRPVPLTLYKAFLKNKKMSGTSLSATFSAWFLNNNIYLIILY